jgi:alpha-glutamyl/putrescinyl thymine pyrophosphorylase clade 1
MFKHWSKYTEFLEQDIPEVALETSVEDELWSFVSERMKIYHKKSAGEFRPWTNDPILHENHFCNLYRELDKTTVATHKFIEPVADDIPLLFLNLAWARWCGLPHVFNEVGLINYSEVTNDVTYEHFSKLESPRFTSAYNSAIAGILKTGCKTREEFIFKHLPKVCPDIAETVAAQRSASIKVLVETVAPKFGFGARFMTMELLMDVGYQHPYLIDERKPVFIGPGAEPAVKALNKKASTDSIVYTLMKNQPRELPFYTHEGRSVLFTAAAIEQICCEFRKYTNLKTGLGHRGEKSRRRIYKTASSK